LKCDAKPVEFNSPLLAAR